MSRWAHVAGIVRLDNILLAMVDPEKLAKVNAIRGVYGKDNIDPVQEATDKVMAAFKENIPTGSEGPLMLKLHIWPQVEFDEYIAGETLTKGSLYWADMIISGDLRDKTDAVHHEVSDWIRAVVLPEGVGIRQGAITIDLEGKAPSVYTCQANKWVCRR